MAEDFTAHALTSGMQRRVQKNQGCMAHFTHVRSVCSLPSPLPYVSTCADFCNDIWCVVLIRCAGLVPRPRPNPEYLPTYVQFRLSDLLTILIPFFTKELKMQRVNLLSLHFMLAFQPWKSFVYLAIEYKPLTVPVGNSNHWWSIILYKSVLAVIILPQKEKD